MIPVKKDNSDYLLEDLDEAQQVILIRALGAVVIFLTNEWGQSLCAILQKS